MKKFYQSKGMLRAGRAKIIIRHPFAALMLEPGGNVRVIAHTEACAPSRDHLGWPKAFARETAGIDPNRLFLYACNPQQAADLAQSIQHQLQPRGVLFGGKPLFEQSVFTTPIEYSTRHL